MIHVTDTITLQDSDIAERFVRAAGPGGQNRNQEATAVELRVDIGKTSLPPALKARLIRLAGRQTTTAGVLVVASRAHRSQLQNREAARARLEALMRRAGRAREAANVEAAAQRAQALPKRSRRRVERLPDVRPPDRSSACQSRVRHRLTARPANGPPSAPFVRRVFVVRKITRARRNFPEPRQEIEKRPAKASKYQTTVTASRLPSFVRRRVVMMSRWLSGVFVLSASAMLAAQSQSPYAGATNRVVSGTIKTVVALPAADGSVGVHFDLRTAEGTVDVHVAPAKFIGQENFWFFADEAVVVTGFTLPGDDDGPIWAKVVKKGSTVLVLRREDDTPRWTAGNDGVDGCGVNHPAIQRTTLQ